MLAQRSMALDELSTYNKLLTQSPITRQKNKMVTSKLDFSSGPRLKKTPEDSVKISMAQGHGFGKSSTFKELQILIEGATALTN